MLVFLGAAVAAFLVFLLALYLGRDAESTGAKLLVVLVALLLGAATCLGLLRWAGVSFEVIDKVGALEPERLDRQDLASSGSPDAG